MKDQNRRIMKALIQYLAEEKSIKATSIARIIDVDYERVRNMGRGRVPVEEQEVIDLLVNFRSLLPMDEEIFPLKNSKGVPLISKEYWAECKRMAGKYGHDLENIEEDNKALREKLEAFERMLADIEKDAKRLRKKADQQKKRIPEVANAVGTLFD